jgi:hypothetical protein
VLIGFLGNWNLPELASAVGERPLGIDGVDDRSVNGSELEMGGGTIGTQSAELTRLAADATRLHDIQTIDRRYRLHTHEPPQRPTINTRNNIIHDGAGIQRRDPRSDHGSRHGGNGGSLSERSYTAAGSSRPTSSQNAHLSPRDGVPSSATSPALRQYTIPPSEGSPMETLPAMRASPALPASSITGPQNLPSLASQVGDLKDAPPPTQSVAHTHTHRKSFSSNSALHSPPKEYRTGPGYPTAIHTRVNGSYGPPYHTEPSPASTNSAISPREYRTNKSFRSMSPPSKFGPRQYQTNGPTPQSDAQTPLSTTSTQTSMRTLSSGSSPAADVYLDPDRMLPPLNCNGPMIAGGFKCDHPGCTAVPFQTQYLLKYVTTRSPSDRSFGMLTCFVPHSSHANVHSQNRPHYCPVKTCSRSEGGKGFKRKNEMIRHGLVHQSPGYICPFCPEREHKYPRPDNLQRCVVVTKTSECRWTDCVPDTFGSTTSTKTRTTRSCATSSRSGPRAAIAAEDED